MSNTQNPHLSHIAIKVEGEFVPPDVTTDLLDVMVDHSLYMPSMFTLRLFNHDMKWLRDKTFREGKKIEIFFGERSRSKLIMGEDRALEPELQVENPTLRVRGYDLFTYPLLAGVSAVRSTRSPIRTSRKNWHTKWDCVPA